MISTVLIAVVLIKFITFIYKVRMILLVKKRRFLKQDFSSSTPKPQLPFLCHSQCCDHHYFFEQVKRGTFHYAHIPLISESQSQSQHKYTRQRGEYLTQDNEQRINLQHSSISIYISLLSLYSGYKGYDNKIISQIFLNCVSIIVNNCIFSDVIKTENKKIKRALLLLKHIQLIFKY